MFETSNPLSLSSHITFQVKFNGLFEEDANEMLKAVALTMSDVLVMVMKSEALLA